MNNPLKDMDFADLVTMQDKQANRDPEWHNQCLLCLDPGHTTGWAVFQHKDLIDCGQIDTSTVALATTSFANLLSRFKPDHIVYEDYRVYKHLRSHHVGSELMTTRVIGCLETLAAMNFIPFHKQMASTAKGFCTDDKLQQWGFYLPGQKHARDAIRHGAYYIMFYHQVKGASSGGGVG